MKDIKDMNLAELADRVESDEDIYHDEYVFVDRLRELHELTRWVSVSERMPTREDADEDGFVLIRGATKDGLVQHDLDLWHYVKDWDSTHWVLTHWKKITPPETRHTRP